MQNKPMKFDFSLEKNSSEMTLFASSTAATLFSLKLTPVSSTSHDSVNIEENCNLDEDGEEVMQPVPVLKQNIQTASKKLHALFSRKKVLFGLNFDEFEENSTERDLEGIPKQHFQKSQEINPSKCFKSTSPSASPELPKTIILPFNEKLISHYVFEPNVDRNLLKNHLESLHKDLIYVTKGLKHSDLNLKFRQVALIDKKRNNRKTLLLDLDDTLIHACSLFENPQYLLTINLPEGTKPIGVNLRPFCLEFIQKIYHYYEIFVFTASCQPYAQAIVDLLDPNKLYIDGILSREYCLQTKNGCFIKDLRIIKNRDPANMILVDDIIHSFAFQLNNGVPVLKWDGRRNDKELKYLYKYLVKCSQAEDLRECNKKYFNLEGLAEVSIAEMFKTRQL